MPASLLAALFATRGPEFAVSAPAEVPPYVRPAPPAARAAPTSEAWILCELVDHSLLYRDLQRRLPAQRACLRPTLARDPAFDRTVTMRLTLDPEGQLHDLALEGPPLDDPLAACLLQSMVAFSTPPSPGHSRRIVRVPLHLHAAPP